MNKNFNFALFIYKGYTNLLKQEMLALYSIFFKRKLKHLIYLNTINNFIEALLYK